MKLTAKLFITMNPDVVFDLCYMAMLLMISVYIDDFCLLMISIMIMLMMIISGIGNIYHDDDFS